MGIALSSIQKDAEKEEKNKEKSEVLMSVARGEDVTYSKTSGIFRFALVSLHGGRFVPVFVVK